MNFYEKILYDFPRKKIYMNNASVSLMPHSCIEKMRNFLISYNELGPDSMHSEQFITEQLIKTRKTISKLLNCSINKIILTQSTTDGVNMVANGLKFKTRSNVILRGLNHEHHANYYPWLKLRNKTKISNLKVNENGFFDMEQLVEQANKNTNLVVLSHALYNTGAIMPINEVGDMLEKKNVPYFIDAAQTIGCVEFNVNKCKCTFASFNGSKWLCGPMGTGIFYCGNPELLQPTNIGGESVILFQNKLVYKDVPNKFQAGFRNYVGFIGLNESANYLLKLGISKIRKITIKLANLLRNELSKIKTITLYGPEDPNMRNSIVSFSIDGLDPKFVVAKLEKQRIILAVREIYDKKIIRISPHFFNNENEVMKTVEAIKQL